MQRCRHLYDCRIPELACGKAFTYLHMDVRPGTREQGKKKLYIHSRVPKFSLGILGAPLAPRGDWPRPFSLEDARSSRLKNFRKPRRHFEHAFARGRWAGRFCACTCSSEPPWDVPNLDFGARDDRFFEVFPCGERSMRKASAIDKTL